MAAKKTNTEAGDDSSGFSAEERAAMKAYAAEKRANSRRRSKEDKLAEEAQKEREAIAALPDGDRTIAARIHDIVAEVAPGLTAKTWYGMPAYAKDDKVVCFFQPASKFGARYGTLGFNDVAVLDDGEIWATSFAVTAITPAVDARIRELVSRAIG